MRNALRVLLVTLVVVLVLLAGYAGTARWLLSGPRLRSWINARPEGLELDYDAAVSRWPGTLELTNLRIRGSDANVQWLIALGHARVRYSVAALFARTFRAQSVEGSGLSFRLRQKLEPSRARDASAAWLPPIPGFSDPPLQRPEPAREPAGSGHPWSVDVRSVKIDRFEEIWFDGYLHRGQGRLDGRFFLRPGELARVGPAAIEFVRGGVRLGPDPLASVLAGRLTATIAEWDPRIVSGDAVWNGLSGDVRLDGRTENLRFVDSLAGGSARFSGGAGAFRIRGTIERGVARGEVRADARRLEFERPGARLTGNAAVELAIAKWKLQGGPMEVRLGRLDLTDVASPGASESRSWWGRFDLAPGRIGRELTGDAVAKCRDARPLYALFGIGLPGWTRGLLKLENLEARANVALGSRRIGVRGLEASGGSFLIHGDYEERGARRLGAFLIETEPLSMGVGIEGASTRLKLIGARAWFEQQREKIEAAAPVSARGAGPPPPRSPTPSRKSTRPS